MGNFLIDMTGQRVCRLVVVARVPKENQPGAAACWVCRCDCGSTKIVSGVNLRKGHAKSCGCLKKDSWCARVSTHRMSKSPEFRCWQDMIRRCHTVTSRSYSRYGARGITVCDRWRERFEFFYADMGPRPSSDFSIERKDNSKGYSPDNCCWATVWQQASNTRRNLYVELRGERICVSEAARRLGVPRSTIRTYSTHNGITRQEAVNHFAVRAEVAGVAPLMLEAAE